MLISVIIPVYNRSQSIRRAIHSLKTQTYQGFEIIVVDDGSTDALSAALCDFEGIKLIRQSNQGVSAARNTGIRVAQGEWIALLDSDDEWLPDKLEQQISCIRKEPEACIIHTDEIWIRNGIRVNQGKRHKKYGGDIFLHCLPLCAMSPSSILIHKEVFETVGMFDESLPACEDYDLWLRICSRYPVHYIDSPLIKKYGGHADQLSQKYWGMDRFRIQALQKIIDTGTLNQKQCQAVVGMLLKKIRIYMVGLAKRDKNEEWWRYHTLQLKYEHYNLILRNK